MQNLYSLKRDNERKCKKLETQEYNAGIFSEVSMILVDTQQLNDFKRSVIQRKKK